MSETLEFTPVYDDTSVKFLESEFARLRGECYVDHAGAALYTDTMIRNIGDDLQRCLYANPHSVGIPSSSTRDIVDHMRDRILNHFNTTPDEYSVIFTSGATASLKTIAETFLFKEYESNRIGRHTGHFVYVQDNHTSVLGMRDVVAARNASITCLGHDRAFQVFEQRTNSRDSDRGRRKNCNSLFVYSAQCNFSGLKYPLEWIKNVHAGALSAVVGDSSTDWYVLLDAASFVPTNNLDLSIFKADFVCLSFYKMFGYPTGIGALLVKNSSSDVLKKVYYGGGTVDVALASEMFHRKRQVLHQRFEDGTVPFLSIASLRYGFDVLSKLTMDKISQHVFSLARILYRSLLILHHCNGKSVAKLYTDSDYEDRNSQGGIVTFNLIRSNGEYVGYTEVANMAALFKIHLRTGCFCNPGACQRHLSLASETILQNYEVGYVCGGTVDLINGRPTGAVRISFGYMSTMKDVETVLLMITKCFVDGPSIKKIPERWEDHRVKVSKKYKTHFCNSNILDHATSSIIDNDENGMNNNMQNSVQNKSENHKDIMTFRKSDNTITRANKCVLQRLFIYPIKSCGAYEILDSWNLNSKGLEYDREWMIITSSGICLTQKHQTNLCLLKPVIFKEKNIMELSYPGMPTIAILLATTYKESTECSIYQSRVCESRVTGVDCGLEVSEWLSLALGKPNLRLIRQSYSRQKKGSDKELSFSSQAQYLAINEASVSWLIDKVTDGIDFKKDTVVHRFRGNIIIKGCNAFEEIQWQHIRIGNNNFKVNGPCTRCQMICIDQTTGKKTIEPLKTLAQEFHGKLRFGIYLTRLNNTQDLLKIGDNIYYS
ncbi:molybdenum cofactor sulfurase 1 [Harpegnathos saltator]|uniref:Molybdenum cofactor sulfurase n=1 Tax=Harpegnathos saltator TaxID=610380 RepID=E2B8H5_HARSA|nr:molybdenum cofactor sulfurase 1 [Harpegnathos saltator]EFN88009.1 Molybdenum cofactor sulfurase [Harpegnathos saltator]